MTAPQQPLPTDALLPIDALLPAIHEALTNSRNLVIEAAPGAGKTTRVPPALLQWFSGEVWVLEPRRMAARLAAQRVAHERHEPLGESVGYQVRWEQVSSSATRLRFLTEGVLLRRLLTPDALLCVSAVVLDEFHERHLETDAALALLRHTQRTRYPGLKLVVMSATLDTAPVARYLDDCRVLSSQGRAFPLSIRYRGARSLPLEMQVRDALEQLLLRERHPGHVLVFLPGVAEIRKAQRHCEALAQRLGAELLPLYGDLSAEAQERAVAPGARQKVVLSTNVAESSITIDGVTAVVDSGLARVASHSPWTGLPTLDLVRISKASADQRAGRAGRTAPGIALRLYAEEDLLQRAAAPTPALLRSDLSGLCLSLCALGLQVDALEWLDAPGAPALAQARALLAMLGIDAALAGKLASLPLPPRLARALWEAQQRGIAETGVKAVALLSAGEQAGEPDLLRLLDAPLSPLALQHARQLRRWVGRADERVAPDDAEEALLQALLTGFPDRIAQRKGPNLVQLASGMFADVPGAPLPYEFVLVLNAEERSDWERPRVRTYVRTEALWLLEHVPQQLVDEEQAVWQQAEQRVDAVRRLRFGAVVLDEAHHGKPEPQAAAAMLAAMARLAGAEVFLPSDALSQCAARCLFAGVPVPDLAGALDELCVGLRSFEELRPVCAAWLQTKLTETQDVLRRWAPADVLLPSGRRTRIHYEAGKPPWIASRLQDFFGMDSVPRLGRDETALVVHLLGPNQRPLQVTTDLAGFWRGLYPQLRRELMRRYPRHAWPEDPLRLPPTEARKAPKPQR